MTRYQAWWQGVDEVMMCELEAKSHKEFRKSVLSQIVIRKKQENAKN